MVDACNAAQLARRSPPPRGQVLRIGILLGDMPRMLRDVVGNILGAEPDLRVVADGVEAGALVERVSRENADVVVLSTRSGSPPAICDELLTKFPRLTVVALEERGHRASIYVMRPMRFRLSDISGSQLVTAIRRAARPESWPAAVHDIGANLADTDEHARTQMQTGNTGR